MWNCGVGVGLLQCNIANLMLQRNIAWKNIFKSVLGRHGFGGLLKSAQISRYEIKMGYNL
jgi:hypothetical protein